MAYNWMNFAGLRKSTSAVTSKPSRGFGGRSRPTEIFRGAYFHLAAALAQLDRLDEAHSAVKAGLALNPTYAISRARAAWTAMSDDPTYLAQLERISKACAKRGCRRNEASLKAGCESGCDARRLSTGRSIRA